jgi:hypothetical protein
MALLHPERLRPVAHDLAHFFGFAARIVDGAFDLDILSGLRFEEEQRRLHAKGRTVSSGICVCAHHPLGLTVTNAEHASDTAHGRGGAGDFAPSVKGKVLWPDEKGVGAEEKARREGMFEVVGLLAKKHGLVWGGEWKMRDLGHIEVPNWKQIPFNKEA